MARGRIYGICLVKNEDDIIEQALTFAARYCDRIFVIDNGSTDDTWNIVHALAKQNGSIVPFEQILGRADMAMRSRVYNAMHAQLSDDDWWFMLDADEFLEEDPRPIIEGAANAGANVINAWFIQFYLTERDVEDYERGDYNRDRPIFDLRRHYLINWQDIRLLRNDPKSHWNPNSFWPEWATRVFRRRILIRHYQYRDPEQISKRLRLRYGHPQFTHVQSWNWKDVVRDSRSLNFHQDGAPWRFSASGVLYFYRRYLYARLQSACRGGAARRIKRLATRK